MIALKSIKSKILIFAILATLIPSLGLSLLSFWQNETVISGNVTYQLRTLATYASRELELWFSERSHDVRVLSTSDVIIDGLSASTSRQTGKADVGRQHLRAYLRAVQKMLGPLLELTVTDAAGHVVASSAVSPVAVKLPDVWSPTAVTEGVVIGSPRWDKFHVTPTLAIAVPVLSPDNELLGALSAVLDLGQVQSRLKGAQRSMPGDVILLDPDGRPLLSTRGTARTLTALNAELLQRLRAQPGNPMSFHGHLQSDVLGLVDLPGKLPITVVAERDRTDVYQAWVVFRDLFLTLVLGLTLLVGVVAWRLGRSIVKPLNRLIGAADRIASGDLAVQLTIAQDDELGRLTHVFNKMADNLRHSQQEIESASEVLQQQNKLLAILSVTDGLTGLYNRKKLNEILLDQIALFQRNQRVFAVLMFDIDHFKVLNDTYGHLAGDEVLVNVARIFSQSIRSVDYAARYGGEEFVIILVDTPLHAALETAERIRAKLKSTPCKTNSQIKSVTVSVGIAEIRGADATPEAVLTRADHALYAAKNAGRNQVHSAA